MIDFVLFRNGDAAQNKARVVRARLIGQDATPETKNDPGHGMLDQDSPLYASDHRGVVVEFDFV